MDIVIDNVVYKKSNNNYILFFHIYIIYFLNVSYEYLISDVFYLKCVTNSFVIPVIYYSSFFTLSQVPDGCCMLRCSGLPAFRINYL